MCQGKFSHQSCSQNRQKRPHFPCPSDVFSNVVLELTDVFARYNVLFLSKSFHSASFNAAAISACIHFMCIDFPVKTIRLITQKLEKCVKHLGKIQYVVLTQSLVNVTQTLLARVSKSISDRCLLDVLSKTMCEKAEWLLCSDRTSLCSNQTGIIIHGHCQMAVAAWDSFE